MWEFSENRDINEVPKEQTEVAGSEITPEAKRKLEEPEFEQESKYRNQDLSNPEEDPKKKLDLLSDASLQEQTELPEIRSPEDKLVSSKTEPCEMSAADPRNQVVDYIINSNLPVSDKIEQLRQYRSDLLSSQQPAPESISDPAEERIPSFYAPDGMSSEYGDSLRPYEMPEGSRMVDSAKIDMSSALGMDNANFWSHHSRNKEDYMALASHLPDVQERLNAGESLDSLMDDPELGATAVQYYSPDRMIRLSEKPNGEYAFTDNGRHRIQAAKELGYDIPALIEPD